jgi:hypothetical protein
MLANRWRLGNECKKNQSIEVSLRGEEPYLMNAGLHSKAAQEMGDRVLHHIQSLNGLEADDE